MTLSNIAVATGALAFVIALLAIAHRLATRFKLAQRIIGKPDDIKALVVEHSLALDARRRLLLIRCEGRQLLLLTGGPQDVLVGWLGPKP